MDLKLTLDNLTYYYVCDKEDSLKFTLPVYNNLYPETRKSKLTAVFEIAIKIFIVTNNNTPPTITFLGENNKVTKILKSENIALQKNSTTILTLSTIDGGNTWYIKTQTCVENISEDSQPVSKADLTKILNDYVKDADYVHTDNNYTKAEKDKVNLLVTNGTGEKYLSDTGSYSKVKITETTSE